MDKKGGVGYIHCRVCGQDWNTNINCKTGHAACVERTVAKTWTVLSAPVDVYADWVDACDEAAKAAAAGVESERSTYRDQPTSASKATGPTTGKASGSVSGEMNDFIEDDDMDAEGEFGDDE
jgi:transcription elongation factor Elf1